jgi:peptide/nickel transport system ATP-binding protein
VATVIKIDRLKIKSSQKELVDIAFNIEHSTALVGQSGSGKSLTLKAILGLLPKSLEVDLDISAPFNLERGKTLSFIPQNPFTALSPLTKISKQFFASESSVKELFDMLDLDMSLYHKYPPNLSGGQLQRVVIAMALINKPKLLLLDEPTTALDSHLKDEIIQTISKAQKEMGFYMLFVTHEVALASRICEKMVVLKDGKVVESGLSQEILNNPKDSYSKLLVKSSFANREFRK